MDETQTEREAIEKFLKSSLFSKRVVTPTVIQMEATECGAASLSIMLSYYGRYVALEELRYHCGVSRDGANAFNMMETGKLYGLEMKAYQLNILGLADFPPPYIIFWRYEHFLIVEGFDKDCVWLNDPAVGPRPCPYEEFIRDYSGYVFTAAPAENFKKGGKPPRFFNLIKERLFLVSPYTYIFLFTVQLVLLLIGLVPTTLYRVFVDEVMGQNLYTWKIYFLFFMVMVILMEAGATFIQGKATNRLTRTLSTLFSVNFLDHLFKMSYLFFSQRFGGEVVNRINLNTLIADFITNNLAILMINLLLISLYAAVMFQYDILITLIGIVSAIANAITFFYIARARKNAYNRMQKELAKSMNISIDCIKNMQFIKCTGSESFSFARVIGTKIRNINNYQSIYLKDIWLNCLSGLFTQLALALLLIVGSWHVMEGLLSLGMLLALQMLMNGFLAPINQVMDSSMKIQTLTIDMMRIDDVLQYPVDPLLIKSPASKGKTARFAGKLEFDHVTFGYSPLDEPLFKDLTFTVEPGQKVAFVGKSGSGKSSIIRLICGLLIPWSGKIYYDGQSITELSKEQIKNSLAWVDQDIFIFAGTIRDNLTLWDKRVTDHEIEIAAQKACIYHLIKERNQGFDTILTEEGSNLSFGEKQRLEIARALLLHPTILVLDEATSALDSHTEAEIFKNIENTNCTCIMIAHRLSTVRNCDCIYVMDKGMIVQQGTHQELKDIPGIYRELVQYDEFFHGIST